MAFSHDPKRSIGFIFVVLIIGSVVGTLFGNLLGVLLPEGVVKQFFLQTVNWGISPVTLQFIVGSITFGLSIKLNISSVLGLAVAYYFLRFYR